MKNVPEALPLVLRVRIAQIESRLQALLDLRLDGEIGKDEYQQKRVELNFERRLW